MCVSASVLSRSLHTCTHRKGRLHQEGEVVNFKQENTPILYSCLIPKWNIQPKIFHSILKFWKPLRFAWEVQVSATYRALCCVHLSCLPKRPTLILTSSVSQPRHCGRTPWAKSVSVGGEVGGGAVLSVRGCLVAFLASTSRCTPYRSHTNANWLHTWPPLQTHCSSVIILRAGADCTIYSVCLLLSHPQAQYLGNTLQRSAARPDPLPMHSAELNKFLSWSLGCRIFL